MFLYQSFIQHLQRNISLCKSLLVCSRVLALSITDKTPTMASLWTSSSANVVVSPFRQCFFLAAVIAFITLSTTTSALPMPLTDVISEAVLDKTPQQERHKREATAESNCDETRASDLQTMFEEINANLTRVSFLQSDSINYPPASDKFEFISGDPNESKTCPSTLTRDSAASLAHRSLCPYYFDILRLPKGYYPPTLRWAKCKCQQCVENNIYGCEAVKTEVAVLKPVGCYQGMRRYEEYIIPVNTACVCAFKGHQAVDSPTTTTRTTEAPSPWVS